MSYVFVLYTLWRHLWCITVHTHTQNVIYLLYICWHSLTQTQLRFIFSIVTHRTRTAFTTFFLCYDSSFVTVFLSTCRYKNILLLKLGFIFTQKVQFVKCEVKVIEVKFALVYSIVLHQSMKLFRLRKIIVLCLRFSSFSTSISHTIIVFYKITFWKREYWLAKSRVSITVWKSSRHYMPSHTAILTGTENLRFDKEDYFHFLVFFGLFYKRNRKLFLKCSHKL